MKETLITLENAKLAKEKDFQELTLHYYKNGKLEYVVEDSGCNEREYKFDYTDFYENWNQPYMMGEYYSAPFQTTIQKWLREVHNIFIGISHKIYLTNNKQVNVFICEVYKIPSSNKLNYNSYKILEREFLDYDKALEEGIKKGLELI